ncbi:MULTISPECIES: helix-turn-helix domain-containing protein [Lactobacillus]|uniref:XRE family transcriptional regulator n=1 Tax=Lactobacillus xujianguonis TaxID=2495899 RepID=A0A437SW85_9LACO|nr:XRE family transcriptional regulator [Lactobacillus xujianguonis]RVU77499.1 XRE family transcriptional regulator [Lactobacillus xujianguonis]
MNNFEALISKKIGTTLKQERIKQHLSQKDLASGICSQGMISSIEHGEYIPNTAIFLALCNRLNLSIDQNFLKEKLFF